MLRSLPDLKADIPDTIDTPDASNVPGIPDTSGVAGSLQKFDSGAGTKLRATFFNTLWRNRNPQRGNEVAKAISRVAPYSMDGHPIPILTRTSKALLPAFGL